MKTSIPTGGPPCLVMAFLIIAAVSGFTKLGFIIVA